MFNYTISNNLEQLKVFLGNGIFTNIDTTQFSKNIYDEFKVNLYRKNDCELEFCEGLSFSYNYNDGLSVKYGELHVPINKKFDNIINIFDKLSSN